jgi:hypothetical protein
MPARKYLPCAREINFITTTNSILTTTTTTTTTATMSLAPPPEAIYPDIPTATTAIQDHAKAHGYAFFRRDKKASRELWACDRAGKYNSKGKGAAHLSKQRASTGSKKCDCLMRVELRLDLVSRNWSLKILEKAHNHAPSSAITAYPAHRIAAISSETRASINNMS